MVYYIHFRVICFQYSFFPYGPLKYTTITTRIPLVEIFLFQSQTQTNFQVLNMSFPNGFLPFKDRSETDLRLRAFNSMLNVDKNPTVYTISLPHNTAEPIFEFARDISQRIIRRQQTEGMCLYSISLFSKNQNKIESVSVLFRCKENCYFYTHG